MNRLIFVPQLPVQSRYSSWWFTEFPKQFRKYFDHVLVLGKDWLDVVGYECSEMSMFSPISAAIDFETRQINEYINVNINSNDTLFLADTSFPGIFANVLYHKPCPKMYAFCHASAKNAYDYWLHVRKNKWKLECAHAKLFDKIFVGSRYHQRKLGWENTVVTALPFPPFPGYEIKVDKTIDILSVVRPSVQKINKKLEKKVEKLFGKITRTSDLNIDNWVTYYRTIKSSKILLITSKEETFGYQVVDAVLNDCIPIAPNKYSYPELLPIEYLYNNEFELFSKIRIVLERKVKVPEIVCQNLMDNFYKRICGKMINES